MSVLGGSVFSDVSVRLVENMGAETEMDQVR